MNVNGESKNHGHSTLYIIGAIVVAVGVAIVGPALLEERMRPFVGVLEVGGEVFLRMLQMVVVPLVMASVMSGILGLGDVRKLGRPGALCGLLLSLHHGVGRRHWIDCRQHCESWPRNRSLPLVEDARKEGEQTIAHVAGRKQRPDGFSGTT